jgi:biopolymer transport protein ExbB
MLPSLASAVPTFLAQLTPTTGQPPSKTILDYIQDGGTLSYILIALSVFGVALMVRNLLALRPSQISPAFVYDELERLARAGDTASAIAFCAQPENDSMLANAVGAGLEHSATSAMGVFELRQEIEAAGRHEVERLHRMNDGLGIIAAVGPMLGLLGTVIGMIGAFGAISALQGAARSSELAKFMSMALVNTAEGLIVAIPCTIAFALFRRRIDRLAGDAANDADALARMFIASSAGGGGAANAARPRATPAQARQPVAAGQGA